MITPDTNPYLDAPTMLGVAPSATPLDPTAPVMLRGAGAGMSAHDFISPTAGRAGSAETAEAKDAAVRPEVKR